MSDEPQYHIFLLPREDYWSWVNAVRGYAAKFGVSVTPVPENAAGFHPPHQVISLVDFSEAYPSYGSITGWLQENAAGVSLDIIEVSSPHELRQLLAERIESGQRFPLGIESAALPNSSGLKLLWPVDSAVITQDFGVNAHIYRRWGLPGHEGIDFRAPLNANVYACAAGRVYHVHDGSQGHAYGIHVRIQHEEGYRTVYAHLNRPLVHAGQDVKAGELIGLANSTGNSTGHHLHLTLKKEGATAAGQTPYPGDIIDPTPYLVISDRKMPDLPPGTWEYDHCLVGLHGRADGPMEEADWGQVSQARIEALKLLSSASSADVQQMLQINPDAFIMVRLQADFHNRPLTADVFARRVESDMRRFYDQGVRYFEIHNEPNLTPEGLGTSWHDGEQFGQWFLGVLAVLKPKFPEARFGWPGLSPGPTVTGMRLDQAAFMERASGLAAQADWIGCHCYWADENEMLSPDGGLNYEYYRSQWPDKLILITEFSNTSTTVDAFVKANQYLNYYRHLHNQPRVGAAFAFVVSASSGYEFEAWRDERGQPSPVAGVIGSRGF